jgi:BON domain
MDRPHGRADGSPDDGRGRAAPLEPPDAEGTDKLLELQGERPLDDQAAWIDQSETDDLGTITDTAIDEGELEARTGDQPDQPRTANLELLVEGGLRSGETAKPDEAAEEGMTWLAPTDPPVVPSDEPGGAAVAAGFGSTSEDEPYDLDHHAEEVPPEDEMVSRVREALRADASTSRYADEIAIGTRDGIVALRGVVDDISDGDDLLAVAQTVTGVDEVIDELDVSGL